MGTGTCGSCGTSGEKKQKDELKQKEGQFGGQGDKDKQKGFKKSETVEKHK